MKKSPKARVYWVVSSEGRVEFASLNSSVWGGEHPELGAMGALDLGPTPKQIGLDNGETLEVVQLRGRDGAAFLLSSAVRGTEPSPLLSPRQRQVASYAAAGATVVEIARILDISFETVRTHLRQVYRRLDVSSRLELAGVFREQGT